MTTFNKAKCEQRNRLAARAGFNAVPLRFMAEPDLHTSAQLAFYEGTLPATVDAALAQINTLLPEGATALTADDVYIHYLEAANDNFIPDRFMFMDKSTLRNIAADARTGVAFMNSHRTGGLSHPSEQPFGKTFAGRFEQSTDGRMRALVGVYMRAGIAPNGTGGPTTDDLHTMILSGTTADCSVGLYQGTAQCDLCKNDLGSKDCGHVPGSRRNMSPEQVKIQETRGVRKGMASYTLMNARMNEVSAVYDGAVPGAGVQKVFALKAQHQLSVQDWNDALGAYGALLQTGALDMDQVNELGDRIGTRIARALGRRSRITEDPEFYQAVDAEDSATVDRIYAVGAPLQPPPPDPQIIQLQAEVAALKQEKRLELAQVKAHAEIDQAVRDRKLWPAQNLSGEGETLLAWLMCQDGAQLTLSDGQQLTPAACFRQFVAAAVPYANLGQEHIAGQVLTNLDHVTGAPSTDPTQPTPDGQPMTPARLTHLMKKASSEHGTIHAVKED